jgi:hypothetical protein
LSPVDDIDQRAYPRLGATRGVCDIGACDTAEPVKLSVTGPTSVVAGASFSIT